MNHRVVLEERICSILLYPFEQSENHATQWIQGTLKKLIPDVVDAICEVTKRHHCCEDNVRRAGKSPVWECLICGALVPYEGKPL